MNTEGKELFEWVKATPDNLPEDKDNDWYFVRAGIDKALWTKKRLIARVEYLKKEGVKNTLEWLKPVKAKDQKGNDSDAVVLTKQELEEIKAKERGRGYEKGYADADTDNDFED